MYKYEPETCQELFPKNEAAFFLGCGPSDRGRILAGFSLQLW